jgi:RNA polymerase sigma-70 factor (ECF subfamily)
MTGDCKRYFSRISEYLDGELDERVCGEIERHLKGCPECRECIESLKATVRLCREGSKERISDDFRSRLRAALRACMGSDR